LDEIQQTRLEKIPVMSERPLFSLGLAVLVAEFVDNRKLSNNSHHPGYKKKGNCKNKDA
jgi:hypothetical protein